MKEAQNALARLTKRVKKIYRAPKMQKSCVRPLCVCCSSRASSPPPPLSTDFPPKHLITPLFPLAAVFVLVGVDVRPAPHTHTLR